MNIDSSKTKQPSRLIVLSGIDCSGKSTQIDLLKNFLQPEHKVRVIWSRGGYTPLIELFKKLIKRGSNKSISDKEYRENVHANSKKRKLLLWLSIFDLILYYGIYYRYLKVKGTTIIADRYIIDSQIDFILKYSEFDFVKWKVWKVLEYIHCKPEVSFVLTIDAQESMRRSLLKSEPFPENIDERTIRILKYEDMIVTNHWDVRVNAMPSLDCVFEKIKGYL